MAFTNKQLRSLARNVTPQSPGICKILFAPVERFETNPPVSLQWGVIDALPGMTGKWSVANVVNQQRDYSEDEKGDGTDTYFESAVTGFLPFDDKDNQLSLRIMKYHRYMVIIIPATGMPRWLGTKDNPVRMVQAYSNRKSGSASKGSIISFMWQSPDKPLLMTVTPASGAIVAV